MSGAAAPLPVPLVSLALAGLLLLAMLVALPPAAAAAELKLAIPLPLTGKQARFGEIMRKSYEIAAQEINAAGGVKGSTLALAFEDSTGKPETARAIVEKLIEGGQPVIVGEYTSACAKAVAALAEERRTPYLIVASADDDITRQGYRYVFRLNPVNAHYADALVSFLAEVVRPRSIAILYESTAFGTSGAEAMEKEAVRLGMRVVLRERYEAGAPDFKPILSRVKSLHPDVVYMVSYVMDASLLMKQIQELRVEAKLFAGGAAGFAIPEFIENAGEAAESVVSATLWTPQLRYEGAREFAAKYRARHGEYPSYHGAAAYAALYVLRAAMLAARDISAGGIRDGLGGVDLETAFGPVRFENRDGYQNQNFVETLAIQVQRGQFETIWPRALASKPPLYSGQGGGGTRTGSWLEVLLQTLISGLLLGGLYALIGLGMTIIMGVMKIINLAHGELMMVGMYVAYALFASHGVDPYLSLLVAVPLLFVLGVAIQKHLVNRVLRVEAILSENQVILTVGIGMVLANLATIVFKSDYRTTPVAYATRAWHLSDHWRGAPFDLSLSFPWTVSFLFAALLTAGLWFFLGRTDTGKSIRATAQDREAALLMGVNVERTRVLTFGLGSALAGAAGCLFIPIYYLYPDVGSQFTLTAFVITILGGLGSTVGAIVGGLILGVFESLTASYLGMAWAPVGRFVVFVAVLIFVPGGVASLRRRRRLHP